jgi:hypothetical protein
VSVAELLQKCQPDREALIAELTPLIQEVMREALRGIETALPDFKELGSADAKLHAGLRSRILNVANGKIRELPLILQNYLLQQVYVRQVVLRASVHEPVSQWINRTGAAA